MVVKHQDLRGVHTPLDGIAELKLAARCLHRSQKIAIGKFHIKQDFSTLHFNKDDGPFDLGGKMRLVMFRSDAKTEHFAVRLTRYLLR